MARRTTPPQPQRPVLTSDQLRRRVERLQSCIKDVEGIDLEKITKRYGDPQIAQVETAIEGALSAAFGHNTPEFRRYEHAARLDNGPHVLRTDAMGGGGASYDAQDAHEARRYVGEGKPRSIALLRGAISELEAEIADREPPSVAPASPDPARQRDLSKIFVVHGHDEGPREAVRSFLLRLGFDPIVLHNQPNKGRTIITKFPEEASDVGFAVVLMTPDDQGKAKDATDLKPRARQNVVFELGFFIGELGPGRVAALVKGGVERPSDFDGVVYIDLDDGGAWKMMLARELRAAELSFDANKVFG